MTTAETIRREDAFQIPTYNKYPISLERGEGSYVWDADGHRYLDFYGGHCVTILGHCPPAVVEAVQRQTGQLMFYSNVVYSSVRAAAAERLAQLAPEGMGHAFFCNSGAEANETALKMARTHTKRRVIVSMEHGFHGRTLGSLAVTAEEKYRMPYQGVLPETWWVPFGDLDALSAMLADHPDAVAGVILEPIQSMAGIFEAEEAYYRGLRALCDQYGVMLIFDEVQTGVGRTGTFSISTHYGMKPDMITLAKSLGAGVPVGAVLLSDAISEGVKAGDQGTTFGGGMLAMAAVEANLATINQDQLMARAPEIEARIRAGIGPLVSAIRGRGCLLGIVLDRPAAPVIKALRERGVLSGGAGDPHVIRIMPALTTRDEEIDVFVQAFEEAIANA